MSSNQLRVLSLGAAFLIMLLSGFWLNRTGKPYGTLIFAVHKAVGLGMGILLFSMIRQIHQVTPLTTPEIITVAFMTLFFIGTVVTGSLLSIPVSKPMPDIVATLNKIFPYITVVITAISVFILLNRE